MRSARGPAAEPPRLVLRFAVLTALGMGLAACAILLIVRHFNVSEAERQATQQARYAAAAAVGDEIRPADYARPVALERRRELDERFRRYLLHETTVAGALVRPGGLVTYSTDASVIGSTLALPAGSATTEQVIGRVTTIADPGGEGEVEVLETVVPVEYPGAQRPMLVVVHQRYAPIAEAAKAIFLPVAGVLELALVLIWIVLVPALGSVTRRIRRQVDEIEHLALHDPLTGLPNRNLFQTRVAEALARPGGEETAVLLLDLDRFREVNDTLGHPSGDELLRALAGRLERVAREGDTIARLGGTSSGCSCRASRREMRSPSRHGRGRCSSAPSRSAASRSPWRRASASRARRCTATTWRRCCSVPTSPCTTRRLAARASSCTTWSATRATPAASR
jgi:hypothetical protein